MGVHDLWSIVEPVRESVPLYSLSGKTLAVDLSLWVCEAQHVQAMMGRVTKPHLRNLFFRVSSLTLMGVKLIFVMEGEAPKLKTETMSKRTEKRFGGFTKAHVSKSATSTSRGRFNAVLRECAEMLDYLGVPWVTAAGEAEAMCAYLDSAGLVDGCITNDGDAFLYGARTVYRNFNMNSKDPQVDCYQTSRVQTELHLSRENLVGLAVLLGCDYIPKGIPGVGREQALRLIQTLRGQSLLQRFKTWERERADMPDVNVKKVPHCNLCRHPGSAKAHERGGCVLCDSQRFCQPQDFDYQCPCDWHVYEQSRQASSLEASVRKKTLANQQFPFTEIINEFLVSKDKPVAHFKRRQPNMLLMQKFAYEKMEWPRHYTSEKVLVLMTYTELMNRKCRRDVPSQIQPVRILKPRVRNAVACFEIIWSTPEHYVFPEERPTEDQHEVRTMEEESLFRTAFPEIVERYLRSKALLEENKTKQKKARRKKEKPSDISDGVSALLAEMTLQTSSVNGSAQQQAALPSLPSLSEKAEAAILDTPVNCKQHRKDGDQQPRDTPPAGEAEAAASPSVSAVIDALHLSDIDWDVSSFTSSPSSQASQAAEPERTKTPDGEESTQAGTKQPELCYAECPLRDRVLMRNADKSLKNPAVISKHPNHGLVSSLGKQRGEMSSKGGGGCNMSTGNKQETLKVLKERIKSSEEKETVSTEAQSKTKEKSNGREKPPKKYKFVKTALSSTSALPQRCHSDPGRGEKKSSSVSHSSKRSVCVSLCSSSEDSDAENQQSGPQRQAEPNLSSKSKNSLIPDFHPKPVSCQLKAANPVLMIGGKSRGHGGKVEGETNSRQDVRTATVRVDEILQTPASPVVTLDGEDSVICSDSPLPLAERLRLKLLY
ncbi:LOW QUALITY PROTEIN: flap endonuclease GEN homolog 1 [Fundulus heteroclitus]|uniref:LOW QUALITY PROTEIN: flap endonuclease GEN homolog 1 n=1 Tax=Fundulus heteroclitus TaxID=8078 RepID=UPI00165CAC97|nr:LOW QUALITY PROTEIN: flap endonuclease GEN homolog 1 [Fundulus heteroclitus]